MPATHAGGCRRIVAEAAGLLHLSVEWCERYISTIQAGGMLHRYRVCGAVASQVASKATCFLRWVACENCWGAMPGRCGIPDQDATPARLCHFGLGGCGMVPGA